MSVDWKEMERQVARILGDWWGCRFRRTPSSGAWSSTAQRGSASGDFHGDIVAPPSANFPFSVECKSYEVVELYLGLYGISNVFLWWYQCECDARRCNKIPLLIMRENRKQHYLAAIDIGTYNRFAFRLNVNRLPRMSLRFQFTPAQFEKQGNKKVQVSPNSLSGKTYQLLIFDLHKFTQELTKEHVQLLCGR